MWARARDTSLIAGALSAHKNRGGSRKRVVRVLKAAGVNRGVTFAICVSRVIFILVDLLKQRILHNWGLVRNRENVDSGS